MFLGDQYRIYDVLPSVPAEVGGCPSLCAGIFVAAAALNSSQLQFASRLKMDSAACLCPLSIVTCVEFDSINAQWQIVTS